MDDRRLKKIAEQYHHEISQMLVTEIRDPRLSGVTITTVRITPDLRIARVYFEMNGGRTREKEVLKGFLRSMGFIKKELAGRVRIRYTPSLEFFYDEAGDLERRVDGIFHQLEQERSLK